MAMRTILPLDEINALQERLKRHFDAAGHIASQQDAEDIIDELLDLFLLAYANGVEGINAQFGTDIEPNAQEIQNTVYRRIEGATWRDRVAAWYETGGDMADIMRIAETEAHRIGNEAAYDTAVKAGAITKTWVTKEDWLVRDTHNYLHYVKVPVDAEFYTFDGDHARFPGDFEKPENNVNCRCELAYK